MMDSIAFFLDNSALSEVDFSHPLLGNPGAGATEYMTVLIASELCKKSVNVTLLTTSDGHFPTGLNIKKVDDIEEATRYAANEKMILVIRAFISGFQSTLKLIEGHDKLKVVIWAHLTPNDVSLKYIANTPQVKAVICLENNQRVRMGDSLANSKLLTIPYGITGSTEIVNVADNSNSIAYIGALVPQKGFHFLADAWPAITKAIPDAKLYVFGSGRLYDSRIEMGSRGIATRDYEDRIFRNLSHDKASVEFLGNANSEMRNQILDKCKLGIVNPSAQTETFCLSAVEFQQRGIPVVGGRKYGLLDTVDHRKTGLLVLRPSRIHKSIIKLMKNDSRLIKYGTRAHHSVAVKYDLTHAVERWHNVFEALSMNSSTFIARETKCMRVCSVQAVFVILNRHLVSLSHGKWPTGIAAWDKFKSIGRPLNNYLRRFIKKR
jgi:glycosyltransferase involved in cell wall biosynthesis